VILFYTTNSSHGYKTKGQAYSYSGRICSGAFSNEFGCKYLKFSIWPTTKLSGEKEVPPVNTAATGTANFTVSPDEQLLHYILTVHNITGAIGADIHWGSATQDGPVVISLFKPAFPTGKVNGILAKGTITSSDIKRNMTSNPGFMEIVAKGNMINKPSVIRVQGLVGSVSDLVTLFTFSNVYVNVHTQMHNNGEIRGQIGPMK